MPAPLAIALTAIQGHDLEQVRDHDPTPYLREKAAAILKVAGGQSLRDVARSGRLRPRRPETISAWVRRYQAEGVAGLRVRTGRGRKSAFFPPLADGGAGRAAGGHPPRPSAVRPGAQPLAPTRCGDGAARAGPGQHPPHPAPPGGAV
ncbi:MAG: helix-turn-helix domain-containing protein [Thermomicrobiales bacterium]|nr:helix-turn-helix domain-containing protein [Thermomicrobiales bacterium]